MRYRGKIIGFLIGILTRRWQFVILGVMLGHLFDMGIFSGRRWGANTVPEGKDPYEVLEISSSATDSEIDSAYRRLMAQYHPDKVASAAQEIRDLAEKRASEINAAYDQIQKSRGKSS
jgi:preprotein translocase subunit Sec63